MNSPTMTSRRWFWVLLIASAAWGFFGARSVPDKQTMSATLMGKSQQAVAMPMTVVLTLGEYPFSLIQGFLSQVAERVLMPRTSGVSVESLQQEIRALEAEVEFQKGQLEQAQQDAQQFHQMQQAGVPPNKLILANKTAQQAGAATSVMILDKGSDAGVQAGMAVIANFCTLGRVEYVNAFLSQVRLITDPHVYVRATIIRKTPTGTVTIAANCQVNGRGNGQLECDTISVVEVPRSPEPGDRVLLLDNTWPKGAQYTTLGEVSGVEKTGNALRYVVRINPIVHVDTVRTVLILSEVRR